MKISYKELVKMNACYDGLERFEEQVGNTRNSVEICDLIGGENTISDLTWLAAKIIPKVELVEFYIKCVRSMKHINNDSRIEGIIALIESWVDDQSDENFNTLLCVNHRIDLTIHYAVCNYGPHHPRTYVARSVSNIVSGITWQSHKMFFSSAINHLIKSGMNESRINDILRELFK